MTLTKVSGSMSNKPVNVKSYGATGDGVTDDTAAFVSALGSNDNVYVPQGIYKTTSVIEITNGKTLELEGGGGTHLIEVDASNPVFDHWDERVKGAAVIVPVHSGYAFSMYSSSTLRGGFIDCRTMPNATTTGDNGAILLDASDKTILDVNVDQVNMVADWKTQETHKLVGIYIECNDGGAAVSQAVYQSTFNVGVSGFKVAHYLHRTDSYPDIPAGLTWVTGLQIYGKVYICGRATWFETNNNTFAGGSSTLEYDYQGAHIITGQDLTIPVVEFSGDTIQSNIRFFDVVGPPKQEYRYKFKDAISPVINDFTPSNSSLIIDECVSPYFPIYAFNRPFAIDLSMFAAGAISTLHSGWYTKEDDRVTIYFRAQLAGSTTGYEELMDLPINCSRITFVTAFSETTQTFINMYAANSDNKLYYASSLASPEYITVHLVYPIE